MDAFEEQRTEATTYACGHALIRHSLIGSMHAMYARVCASVYDCIGMYARMYAVRHTLVGSMGSACPNLLVESGASEGTEAIEAPRAEEITSPGPTISGPAIPGPTIPVQQI